LESDCSPSSSLNSQANSKVVVEPFNIEISYMKETDEKSCSRKLLENLPQESIEEHHKSALIRDNLTSFTRDLSLRIKKAGAYFQLPELTEREALHIYKVLCSQERMSIISSIERKWSTAEHALLHFLVKKYLEDHEIAFYQLGLKDWNKIVRKMPGRSIRDCSEKWEPTRQELIKDHLNKLSKFKHINETCDGLDAKRSNIEEHALFLSPSTSVEENFQLFEKETQVLPLPSMRQVLRKVNSSSTVGPCYCSEDSHKKSVCTKSSFANSKSDFVFPKRVCPRFKNLVKFIFEDDIESFTGSEDTNPYPGKLPSPTKVFKTIKLQKRFAQEERCHNKESPHKNVPSEYLFFEDALPSFFQKKRQLFPSHSI